MIKTKKRGNYVIIKMDPLYSSKELDSKEIFGINLEQQRNNAVINKDQFVNIVTDKKENQYGVTMCFTAIRLFHH